MASKAKVARFAREWLAWYPVTTELELQVVLNRRFQGSASVGELAGSSVKGGVEGASLGPGSGEGCMFAVLLFPLFTVWHAVFPIAPTQPEDIDAVLAELRATGQWPDAYGSDVFTRT